MEQEAGTVGPLQGGAELAGLLGGDFDLVTAVRVLAAAVLSQGREVRELRERLAKLEGKKSRGA